MNRIWRTCTLAALVAAFTFSCSDRPDPNSVIGVDNPVFDVTGTPNKQFWKQCQNNHDYAYECKWVTGNLTHAHNTWAEGDFVPKVLRIDNINNGDPFEIEMTYGFLKGGLTTHEFLGKWDDTQYGANPCVDGSFSPFCTGNTLNAIDAMSNTMDVLSQTAVDNACGATSQYSTDMAEAISEVGAAKLVIEGINVDGIVVDSIKFDGCPPSGDAEANLYMTVDPNTDAFGGGSPGVLLLMAAHVARGADWDNGGAGGVNGSPYHLGLVTVDDESAGSMDLQMAAAAVVVPAVKTGTKFEDLDADGQPRETGEPGLSGWTIYVDYADDGFTDPSSDGCTGEAGEDPCAVTDVNGDYEIMGILPGTYNVKEVAQAGWTCSFPDPCYYEDTFESADTLSGNDFGNYTTTSKSGVKFEDLDADGAARESGEPGLSGWTIYVDYNSNGSLDAGEPSATTGSDGSYTIDGIDPGTWYVREVGQDGWTCSYPNAGTETAPVASTQCYHQETFESGVPESGNDFGNWTTTTKSGTKFEDLDADGAAQESGEPGLSGWTIYVDYNDNGSLDTGEPSATTGSDGSYTIDGIDPGTWYVREVGQDGWTCSFPNAGTETAPVASTQCYHQETFESGVPESGNDFGNWTTTTKSGTKFEDLDADGAAQESGEPGLSGWTIYVDYNDNGSLDTGEPSATTGSDGSYTIDGIDPGTWYVREVGQDGWTCSYPNAGTETAPVASTQCYHQETFESGVPESGNDFGNWTTTTKSGTKFEDENASASRDTGEPGLSGWTIYVDYNDNGALDTGEPSATTGSDGSYTIDGIVPGVWKVREVLVAPWLCTYPTTTDANGCYHQETFESGVPQTGNDFGNFAGKATLAPTQTTCQIFQAGTSEDQQYLYAHLDNGNINNVSPGVFFYYTEVLIGGDGSTNVAITQTNDGELSLFDVHQDQAWVYDSDCNRLTAQDLTVDGGQASGTVTGTPGAIFIVAVKYSTDAVVDELASLLPEHYTFTTYINGVMGPSDALDLIVQP